MRKPEFRALQIATSSLCLFMFIGCLISPAILEGQTPANAVWHRGWMYLLMGWIGVFEFQFGWFANPLLFALIVSVFLGARANLWFAVIATGLICSVFFWRTTHYDVDAHNFAYGPGYWLWLGCSLLLLALALYERVYRSAIHDESA